MVCSEKCVRTRPRPHRSSFSFVLVLIDPRPHRSSSSSILVLIDPRSHLSSSSSLLVPVCPRLICPRPYPLSYPQTFAKGIWPTSYLWRAHRGLSYLPLPSKTTNVVVGPRGLYRPVVSLILFDIPYSQTWKAHEGELRRGAGCTENTHSEYQFTVWTLLQLQSLLRAPISYPCRALARRQGFLSPYCLFDTH